MNRNKILDIAERTAWTFAQGGLAVLSVEGFDLPPVYVPFIAGALASLKSFVATKVGKRGTASTLPATVDQTA